MIERAENNAYIRAARVAVAAILFMLLCFGSSYSAAAEDTGLPADYKPSESDNRDLSDNTGQNRYGIPWHQFKNILTEETVAVQDITVVCEPEDEWYDEEPVKDMKFRVYNSTTQETEAEVTTDSSGTLKLPRLRRGHTYILFADSDEYLISGSHNIYLWALAAGDRGVSKDGAYDHKTKYIRIEDDDPVPADYLTPLTKITVKAPGGTFYDPAYFPMKLPVTFEGQPAPDGIKFRFTSAEDATVEAVTKDGFVSAELLEDNDYTVHVDDGTYGINTFALAVKDKSEHKYRDGMTGAVLPYDRYTYDHTCCQGYSGFTLVRKSEVSRSGKVSSLKKYGGTNTPQATVTGMDFKTLLLLVRYPAVKLPAGCGVSDYDAVELTLANPHRWEKCKITDTEFTVNQMLPQQRAVKNVYQLRDGALEALPFTQNSSDSVEFVMNSMSLYPVVIEYAQPEPAKVIEQPEATALATSIKKIKAGKKKITVTWKKRAGNTTGYQIQYSRKKNFKKAKTVTVRGAKKTKKTIKKLKSRKKYYVRIRTYRTAGGSTVYSRWSKAKTVRVR